MLKRSGMKASGKLVAKKIPCPRASFTWRVENNLRKDYIRGKLGAMLAPYFTKVFGHRTWVGSLAIKHQKAGGSVIDYGIVSYLLVTTAFVEFVVDQLQTETSEFGDFKFHDSGVGVTGANIADTDIETTDGESRATGSQTEGGSANIYKSVGTISYTSTKAITEHGLFSQSTGTTLMDRHTFSAINVVNGDSIQFTFELTLPPGG